MAVSISENDGDDEFAESHEINVTPFIDVMLVLLIIFMVAAPLSTVDAPVDLPLSNAEPQDRPDEPIYLTVQADNTLLIGDDEVDPAALAEGLDAATGGNRDERILLRADGATAYGDLMEVMNQLRTAGYLKIGLVGLADAGAGAAGAAAAGRT